MALAGRISSHVLMVCSLLIVIALLSLKPGVKNKTASLASSNVIMDGPALEMRYRQTKIIFTIGPATSSDEVLKQLVN